MIQYAKSPLSLRQTIESVLLAYPVIFRVTFLLVIVSAVGHLIVPEFFILNTAFGAVATLAFILYTWFFFTAILSIGHVALQGGHMKFKAAFRIARQHYLWVLASNILFFAIGLFLLLIEYALDLLFDIFQQHPAFAVLSVIIDVYLFVILYFAIPLIILDHARVIEAFEQSVRLVKHNWWRTFIVLAFVGCVMLGFEALGILFSGKARILLFTVGHFLLEVICYPLIVSATLILLHDLKLRFQAKENISASTPMKKHSHSHS